MQPLPSLPSMHPLPPIPFLFRHLSFLPLPILPPFFFSLLMLGDRKVYRLAYLVPHLVCGCPCPWVVKNRVFLLSALFKILADFQHVRPITQPQKPYPCQQADKAHSSVLCFLPYRKPILFPSLTSRSGLEGLRLNLLHQCLDGALAGSGQGIMSCIFIASLILVCRFYCARSLNCNKQGEKNFFRLLWPKTSV